ncbi:cupin domain-containing protein [Halorubrum trueperi]|uniref:Cupin domain-containing protein n=1 Tax=Halorubrum trueperi TaxID=2004704 RepID=A0ABD5UR35_9EURY
MGRVNETNVEWTVTEKGDARFRRKQLAEAAGGERIGCSLYELPPGAKSWPYHYHTANEEALYVCSGEALLRLGERGGGDDSARIAAGDYVAFPADESGAHRVVNDGDEPVRYLVVSTMIEPDVTVYPDSGTFGVFVGSPPGGREERSLSGYYDLNETVDYWAGDDDDAE